MKSNKYVIFWKGDYLIFKKARLNTLDYNN